MSSTPPPSFSTTNMIPSFSVDGCGSWKSTSTQPLPSPSTEPVAPSSTLDSSYINSSTSNGSISSITSLRTLVTLPSPTTSNHSTDFGPPPPPPPSSIDSSLSLSPTASFWTPNGAWSSSVGGLPTRSNSVSSTRSNSSSKSKTDSFFSRGLGLAQGSGDNESLTPPKPLPGSGSSLGRAGSMGRASLGTAGGGGGGSRLVPGSLGGRAGGGGLGGGGPRSNRSVSDATSRPLHLGGGEGIRPFFSFEREGNQPNIFTPPSPPPPPPPIFYTPSSLPSGPIDSSSHHHHSSTSASGLPPPSLANSHDLISTQTVTNLNREATRVQASSSSSSSATSPATKEPEEGDELVELVLLEDDDDDDDQQPTVSEFGTVSSQEVRSSSRKKIVRRKRRWRLVGGELGRGAFSCVWGARLVEEENGGVEERKELRGLVAVKMMSKELCLENSRTLTSFTREVEILKTLHHPSIIPHLTSFSTPTHHVLALPYLPGGELFSIVASPELWSRVGMGWVRRVWGELEAAVGWLHGQGVVHRDVKLENVLLTIPLPSLSPALLSKGQTLLPKSSFPPSPTPLINLADFGLAKRLPPPPEPATLTTRCGSDSFACPEIIMGKEYDGRKADSWACGVVLFAMLTRSLPFGSPPTDDPSHEPPALRRSRMLRIAKGEYAWPPPLKHPNLPPASSLSPRSPPPAGGAGAGGPPDGSCRLIYHGLHSGAAARKVVEGLLKRDPAKRLRVGGLGEVGEEWLGEENEEEGDWGVE